MKKQTQNWKPIGHPLTPERLKEIESELNVTLPDDYRQFMLKHNGATPPDSLYVVVKGESRGLPIEFFYALSEPIEKQPGTDETMQAALEQYRSPDWNLPDFLLPIACADQEQILLSVHPDAFRHVYRVHAHEGMPEIGAYADGSMAKYYREGQRVPTAIEYIEEHHRTAKSFTKFLGMLESAREYDEAHDETTPIMKAMLFGDVEAVKQLLDGGLDAFAPDPTLGLSPHGYVQMMLMQLQSQMQRGMPKLPEPIPDGMRAEMERMTKVIAALPVILELFNASRPAGAEPPKSVMEEMLREMNRSLTENEKKAKKPEA